VVVVGGGRGEIVYQEQPTIDTQPPPEGGHEINRGHRRSDSQSHTQTHTTPPPKGIAKSIRFHTKSRTHLPVGVLGLEAVDEPLVVVVVIRQGVRLPPRRQPVRFVAAVSVFL
jgi:hypothetical protein